MKIKFGHFSVLLMVLFQYQLTTAQKDSLALEKIRTESGVDPTRVNSRAGYSLLYYKKNENRSQISNRISAVFGVNRWSFSIKPEITSIHTGVPGSGFNSGLGDVKFSILNAFYVEGSNAMAGSVEFGMPFSKSGLGVPYFTATPSFTYSHTFNPTLILAMQPQYTFSLAKDPIYPDLNVITLRTFLAKFTKSGYFFVFEPRTIYNIEDEDFDLIISPIVGKALGAGFNLIGILEIPVTSQNKNANNTGILFQCGFNKNF